jgi:hypothetical protein
MRTRKAAARQQHTKMSWLGVGPGHVRESGGVELLNYSLRIRSCGDSGGVQYTTLSAINESRSRGANL